MAVSASGLQDRLRLNGIADAERALDAAEMAREMARVRQQVARLAGPGACLAFAPGRSAADAILLIALLAEGFSLALLPDGAGVAEVPPFAAGMVHTGDPPTLSALRDAPARPVQSLYVQSSGSTGKPKWILHGVDGLLANAELANTRFGITAADRVLVPVPFHHMFGLGAAILPALLGGAGVVLAPQGTALDILQAERAHDPTTAFMVPSQCRSLMALRRAPRAYRCIVAATDHFAPREAVAFEAMNGRVAPAFGSTECGVIAAHDPSSEQALRLSGAVPLLPGVRVAHPPEDPGSPFPLAVIHPAAAVGYPDETGHVATPVTVWESGDHVRMPAPDRLQIVGRIGHSVKRDGLMVHLADIEAVLRASGLVQAVAVVIAGQIRRGAGLVAFCAAPRARADLAETLRAHCREHLPARAVPDHILIRADLPQLAMKKPDRVALTREAEAFLDRLAREGRKTGTGRAET